MTRFLTILFAASMTAAEEANIFVPPLARVAGQPASGKVFPIGKPVKIPAPLGLPDVPLTRSPLTAQLSNTRGGCWESVFSFPPVRRNDDRGFIDRAD